jgi:hypothetical protein
MIDIAKIIKELDVLPEYKRGHLPFGAAGPAGSMQMCIQGTEEDRDPYSGCNRGRDLLFKEEEYIVPLFDIPYTNSIIKELNMYRTRVIVMFALQCYSFHKDPTKRIHIPLVSNKNSFLIVDKELIQLPADGNYYLIDTTQSHTAFNAHGHEKRIHMIGSVN